MIPGSYEYRKAMRGNLLKFGAGAANAAGFGCLDMVGGLDNSKPTELYITGRMTHIYSLALLNKDFYPEIELQRDTIQNLAQFGVQRLLEGSLVDDANGGWFDTFPATDIKSAYGHAFVMLAAASAVTAKIPNADKLLSQASRINLSYFYDVDENLVVDELNSDWSRTSSYRGLNSNMHTVEAYLAVGAATQDGLWFERAQKICLRVLHWAKENNWRVPEHFSEQWEPRLDYNQSRPSDPFRPFGATVGHGFEWARLFATTSQYCVEDRQEELLRGAMLLAMRAFEDGWERDGAPGFVYTTDWEGAPVHHARMHWVVCEAIAAFEVLYKLTGDPTYEQNVSRWWNYVEQYFVDREYGSWFHELDSRNQVAQETWDGKPDIYHAYQACLIADLDPAASFAEAIRRGHHVC